MKHRCTNKVGGARCGVRVPNTYGPGKADHIQHWPHRYIEVGLAARWRHERALRTARLTTRRELVLAMLGWARNPGR